MRESEKKRKIMEEKTEKREREVKVEKNRADAREDNTIKSSSIS